MNFEIKYKQGSLNGNADGVSRIPMVAALDEEKSFLHRLRREQQREPWLAELCKELQVGQVTGKFTIDDEGIIWRVEGEATPEVDYRLVVPENMKKEVLDANHNHILAGHGGIGKTCARTSKNYYWPNMAGDVAEHCNRGRRKYPSTL